MALSNSQLDDVTSPTALSNSETKQYSTFRVAEGLYGIDVTRVQEVVKPMFMTKIPLAPDFVHGLINLRGQVVTAIGLRQLFGLSSGDESQMMNVICDVGGSLVSLLVDEICDVIEVSPDSWEQTPGTIDKRIRGFMSGVHKTQGVLLSIIDVKGIDKALNDSKKGEEI